MLYQKEIDDSILIQMILLFTLNKAKKPLSHDSVTNIVLDNCNISYSDYLIALDNLVKTHHIKKYSDKNGVVMYKILEKGVHAGEFFSSNIPVYITEPIAESIKPVIREEIESRRISGGIMPMHKKGEYGVECIIRDDDGTEMLNLVFYAGDREQAAKLFENFRAHPEQLYEAVVKSLAK